jgi:uncharacterized tellurite resistance protein B-like protein
MADEQAQQRDQTVAGVAQLCLAMAYVDGELAAPERGTVLGILGGLLDGQVTDADFDALAAACDAVSGRDGTEAVLKAAAARLPTPGLRRYGLLCVARVMLSDLEAKDEELALFFRMAEALALDEAGANAVLEEAMDLFEHRAAGVAGALALLTVS